MAFGDTCDPRRLDQLLHDRLPEDSQRDLEAHLLDCPACRRRLDELAGGPAWWAEVRHHLGGDGADVLAWTAAPSVTPGGAGTELDFLQPSDKPGSLGRLGPYEIVEVLGHGGMGVVLKAFDPALHRPVAIKVLAAEYAARGAARKRFAREARAAAAVAHEHVVPVHAVDAEATPPYLVMAFIPGESLQERIDRTGPLELREILRIGMQTAAGLAAAHAQGLVHRDIKPANIMLENGIERVRITDFGLARAVDDASVTQSGSVAGTPQYMAPEQAGGGPVDQRADLFALGSTLYAMCTGLAPFRGTSGWGVLRQVCEAEPEPLRSINPDVPVWLEGIVRKLHAKDPAQRLGSAALVAELLEGCLAHVQQPDRNPLPPRARDLARLVPAPQRPRRQRRPWHRLAALAVVAGLAGVALVFLPQPAAGPDAQRGGEAGPATTGRTRWADTDDELRWQSGELETRLDALRRSLTAPEPREQGGTDQALEGVRWRAEMLRRDLGTTAAEEQGAADQALGGARWRAEMLRRDLSSAAAPVPDPVQTELENIRRRLEQLRQNMGKVPD
jgi:serine/threonine protein kinase